MSISFSSAIIIWHRQHGRHHLPWQQDTSAYTTWVSETMLQQTQVSTVIPYYQRFINNLPTISILADANIDDVLALWSGLGYYARARHLHQTAQDIVQHHQGIFPNTYDDLVALPGIGRSTAGAILSLAFGQPAAILDGNAKRVFARYYGVLGWPGARITQDVLWQHAKQCLPRKKHAKSYTQGLMDLGALLCKRSNPDCKACPLHATCYTYLHQKWQDIPAKKPKKTKPKKTIFWLAILHNNTILLQQNPLQGIWAGLWCLPDFSSQQARHTWCGQYEEYPHNLIECASFTHQFTHLSLTIHPAQLALTHLPANLSYTGTWINLATLHTLALASPTKKYLQSIGLMKDNASNEPSITP